MGARILIIEDNPDHLELMRCLLKASGHVPLIARGGAEALRMACLEKPEMILCDVRLPALDGYNMARRLKSSEATRAIPLVAVTALAMVGDRDKILGAGFDGYFSKPIDPQAFVSEMEEFLGKQQQVLPLGTHEPEALSAESNAGLGQKKEM